MAAPTLQFKRGLLANLPGLRGGEPGFTTDSYDLYVGIDSTTANNQFVGSGRYWSVNSATKGSGVNLVEGTNNGTSFITFKSPDALAGIVTFVMPGTDGSANDVLKTDGAGNLSFGTPAASSFTLAADSGSNDTFNTGETLTFTGGDGIDTSVSNNAITITASDITTTQIAAATLVTESEGIGSNDNDTTLPTSAAVKDYVDTQVSGVDVEFGTAGDSGTGTVNTSQTLTVSGTANEIVTSASGQGITIALPDDVTIGQDLTVTRNLIVNGSTTQVNVENMTVDDPLVSVGTTSGNAPGADFGKDLGLLMHYYSSGAAKLASVYWDNSASRMVMASVVTETSAGSNVLTATTRATVEIGSLMLSDAAGTGESVITTSGSDRVLENITVDGGSF